MREVIAVLRGGPSSEYDVSLKSGASVLEALDKERYEPRDIFIDRAGLWHVHGAPLSPERALRGVDVAFNVVHGEYGEDGRLHRILDQFGVPYTGSDATTSTLIFNKQRTREAAARLGVKVAHGVVIDSEKISDIDRTAQNLFRSFPHPAVIKPLAAGSSVGISIADSFEGLVRGLQSGFSIGPKVLVEEYIPGREASVGVIDNFRGEKTYALMPIEIHNAEILCPGNFSKDEKRHLATVARLVHEGLGLSHYSHSDFVVSKRGIYFIGVSASPDLTNESLLPKALKAVGAKLSDFIDHIIRLAKNKKNV